MKKRDLVTIGTRIQTIEPTTWHGVTIPSGTKGTVYAYRGSGTYSWRAIRFDGFPEKQPSGFTFHIGGDVSKTYCPNWAKVVKE
jgi:hypothetical protein